MFSNYIYSWLDTALDCDITENEFWHMTLAEVERAIKAYKRKVKNQQQEKASFDYILADLIGRSISRMYSSQNKYPDIEEAYPSLFNQEEVKEKRKEQMNNLSAMRFKQFADNYNAKYRKKKEEALNE